MLGSFSTTALIAELKYRLRTGDKEAEDELENLVPNTLTLKRYKQMEDKIKEHYIDMLRTYNANYLTLMTQEPFGATFRVTQGKLYATEHLLEWFEREFSEICHCEYDWHKEWKDENFKKRK